MPGGETPDMEFVDDRLRPLREVRGRNRHEPCGNDRLGHEGGAVGLATEHRRMQRKGAVEPGCPGVDQELAGVEAMAGAVGAVGAQAIGHALPDPGQEGMVHVAGAAVETVTGLARTVEPAELDGGGVGCANSDIDAVPPQQDPKRLGVSAHTRDR